MIRYLANSMHFPVSGREITDILQGLLSKYRALILQLQDEILNRSPEGQIPPEVSEKKIQEMQRDMAQLMLDKNTAEEDRNRIFEMMELLKAKYKTILEEKAALNQELIQVCILTPFFKFLRIIFVLRLFMV